MATTQLEVCNRALQKIGAPKLSNLAGTDQYTVALLRCWTDALDYELRTHNWNFAIRRARLTAASVTITGITAAEPPVVTYTGTDPENDERVYISDVLGMTEVNGNYYRIADINTTANTFELTDVTDGSDIDGSAFTAYTSDGTAYVSPHHGWNRKFLLPSTCVKLISIDGMSGVSHNLGGYGSSSDFTVEGRYIVTNEAGPLYIRYITNDLTNHIPVDKWDSMFKEVIACRIALELQHEIKQDDAGYERIAREYAVATRNARLSDAIETPGEVMPESDWLIARL